MKPLRVFLFSAAYPMGFLHEGITQAELDELESSGEWFDHPSKVPGADPSMSNRTGGDTRVRARGGEVRYSDADLRAMFMSGKDMSASQIARLVTALQLQLPDNADEEAVRQLIDDALNPERHSVGAGHALTTREVRQLEPAGEQPTPLKPKKPGTKAPAKKAPAKKADKK